MSQAAKLPETVKTRILSFPEYQMGAHRVALVLKDGQVIEDVTVAWGDEIVSVGGVPHRDFPTDEVVDAENRA